MRSTGTFVSRSYPRSAVRTNALTTRPRRCGRTEERNENSQRLPGQEVRGAGVVFVGTTRYRGQLRAAANASARLGPILGKEDCDGTDEPGPRFDFAAARLALIVAP